MPNIGLKSKYPVILKVAATPLFLPLLFVFLNVLFKYEASRISKVKNISSEKFSNPINSDISRFLYFKKSGIGSYYSNRFHNRRTASGLVYDKLSYTAAHKELPFGSVVRVKNSNNNKTTFVLITDRGPFSNGRVIDLSYASAKQIDGLGLPKIEIDGFNPEAFQNDDLPDNFYFAYSTTKPLLCIPLLHPLLIDSTTDFDNIIEKYFKLSGERQESNFYIFIPVKDFFESFYSDSRKYYLGMM